MTLFATRLLRTREIQLDAFADTEILVNFLDEAGAAGGEPEAEGAAPRPAEARTPSAPQA